MTLDEISKQVESLRAEVEALKARPPSIVVNRGDQLVVQYANPVQPQVILECKAAPEKPAEPQPIDAFARDAVRAAVEKCCECICQGCAEEMPLLEPAVHGRQYNEHGDIEGGPCAADSIRRAFADVMGEGAQ